MEFVMSGAEVRMMNELVSKKMSEMEIGSKEYDECVSILNELGKYDEGV